MSFRCDPATLERLEWERLVECLAACAATDRGKAACRGPLFQASHASALDRLAETGEARALFDAELAVPLGGAADVRDVLDALGRGAPPPAADFARVQATLEAAERMRGFFADRAGRAPRLADLAATLPGLGPLAERIGRVVTPDGDIRADASPELRRARRRVRQLEVEVETRMAALLRDPRIQPHLQDHYATRRDGRPVLPVRADARTRVGGIVHDVSSSGTTVFIEPEPVVELGNSLRVAQTEVDREVERLLRELGEAVRASGPDIDAAGATLETLDVACARGRLSRKLDACAPDVAEAPALALRELRHPLLLLEAGLAPEDVVENDVALAPDVRGLVISGPNAGGKTVVAKALGLAALALRAGLHVPCAPASRMSLFDSVWADIGDEQDLRSGLSTFSARMTTLARIVSEADERTLVILDEVGEGTEPGEGAAIAQSVLEALVERGAHVVATTHFNRLKELAGADARFANASAEFDAETLLPTFRIHVGVPGSSGATWVAERMGIDPRVVERARDLLDREDRKLESLTRALSELRQELEAERQLASRMRQETESTRREYETRLASLRSAREQALAAIKADLETAFKSARAELAAAMRDVQQRDQPDGRRVNRAYRRVEQIRERTAAAERAHAEPERGRAIDWSRVEPGARLELRGIRGEAVLLEGPDRRGRVVVRVGGARTELPARRVRAVHAAAPPAPRPRRPVAVERGDAPSGLTPECDVRGLRVDEALDRAEAHLHGVLGHGVERVRFIHGHGTGALRSALRAWLRDAPGVARFEPGGPREGGNGVTVATLTH